MDPVEAIFRSQNEGFRQIVTGHHLAVLFRLVQKFPGPFGGGGVVQVKYADNGRIPHRHVIADG